MLPAQIGLEIQSVETTEQILSIQLNTTNPTAKCPLCAQLASKIQSHCPRKLADLSWAGYFVHFKLDVRRFWCLNPQCKRRIFCERLDQITQVYARRTNRLTQFLQKLALALGGRPAARLALKQGVATSSLSERALFWPKGYYL